MVEVISERTEESKTWKIPGKFINYDFASFLDNTFPLSLLGKEVNLVPITGWGSIYDSSDYFQLEPQYGITLDDILKLLKQKDCIEVDREENQVVVDRQNIEYLRMEILGRIED